jgi:hypothetical protein
MLLTKKKGKKRTHTCKRSFGAVPLHSRNLVGFLVSEKKKKLLCFFLVDKEIALLPDQTVASISSSAASCRGLWQSIVFR